MNLLYFDCFSGVSGDMMIAALLDCGAPFAGLQEAIAGLGLGVELQQETKVVQGIRCTDFRVLQHRQPPLRHLPQILKIIDSSPLSSGIKEPSARVFEHLARVEARVHGMPVEKIHFHEIGAADTIVDIVGTFYCLKTLAVERVYASALPWSRGFVDISHGRYPLPAPATALLLQHLPCVPAGVEMELVTPTGAALLAEMVNVRESLPPFVPTAVGYGAGKKSRPDRVPNLLRAVIATGTPSPHLPPSETVAVLETQVDDITPEMFTYLYHLFMAREETLDFFTTPIIMKKNRPGFLLTLIARPEGAETLQALLLQETPSLGVRSQVQKRRVLPRQEGVLATPWGPVRIKTSNLSGSCVRVKPEFDDCQRIALEHDLPLMEVYATVSRLAWEQGGRGPG